MLERLLEPLSPAQFFQEHWERAPVHLVGRARRFEGLALDPASFWETVRRLPAGTKNLRAIYYDPDGQHQEILELPPALAPRLFDAGMTVVFPELEDHSEPVRAYVRSLREALDLPGHVTAGVFYSPKGHGAGLHYDNHSAIVLQLEGRKSWLYSKRPALEFPPSNYGYGGEAELLERNARFPELATRLPREDELTEAVLEPGDLLYLPPGTWHRPRAVADEGSFALTLGPFVKSARELVTEQLTRGLGASLEWRRSVPVAPRGPATVGLPPDVEAFFEARLRELRAYVSDLRPSDLARLWHAQVAPSRPRLAPASVGTGFAPEDRVVVSRERRVSRLSARDAGGEEKLFLYVDGDEIDFPASASRFLETLLSRESFVASEAQAWVEPGSEPYDWDDVSGILEVLGSRGLLLRSAGR